MLIEKLADTLSRNVTCDGVSATSLARVHVLCSTRPTDPIHVFHKPAVCFVAQGRKQTMLGENIYLYEPPQFLIVSAELPVTGQILEASPERPYLCFRLDLDPIAISSVIQDAFPTGARHEPPKSGLDVSTAPDELLDAVVRMAALLDVERETDRQILAPLAEREILYRLLMGEQASRLQQIAYGESKLSQIGKAISWIKANYARSIRVEEVAAQVNMSTSSFHEHFRTVTSMSPLQFQKQIRLQEARRMMLTHAVDAATAGFNVGYESPSQFSREYSRHFGLPPKRDIEKLRTEPAFV
ncbi:AraC family transcriptional regulator [Bradyrhizobium sp. BRP19]|uniref:AraC family transcriptional regulator n=1 Tax=Bradyrhizobium sp. BRP19 TaxID=2793823 RepID=UPI001CD6BCE2|nr:AraC family transcriptional regulator [Bradyrhizobium sp. BRP19]MCA1552278.1 AraC family transcriptional regulator [Bradyrhizobium sp. BRP19]